MSDAFRNRVHAAWRELLQIEPISAEDESQHSGFLRWIESGAFNEESSRVYDRLLDIAAYLEERAFAISRMTLAERRSVMEYRRLRDERLARDSWQKSDPRILTKAEHDALLADAGVSVTRTLTKEEYEQAMREAQE